MTPTDICVSLETAKALKEAGWEKETVHKWVNFAPSWEEGVWDMPLDRSRLSYFESLPAPTLGELLDSVKMSWANNYCGGHLRIGNSPASGYFAEYYIEHSFINTRGPDALGFQSSQEALAQLWINHPEIRKS